MNLRPISISWPLVCFFITFTFSFCSCHQADFTVDVAINCGSTGASAARDGRQWLGDVRPKLSPLLQLGGLSVASTAIRELDPVPHKTARISRSLFSYSFQWNPGQKIIRLHFNPTLYRGFEGFRDFFTVEAGPFTLLANFSASLTAHALGVNTFVKEFCLNIEENQQLTLTFSPEIGQFIDTYAFINGIEIVSVPATLSYFDGGEIGLRVVGQKSPVYVDDSTALEIVHRLNIKQDPVPATGDFYGVFPKWAKQRAHKLKSKTWKMPVEVGFRYLIRLHLSEAGLKTAGSGGSMFKILINEMVALTSSERGNGIVLIRDYMVAMRGRKRSGKRDISISLHELADGHGVLAGFEIVKLSNADDSLASPNPLPPPHVSRSHSLRLRDLLLVLGYHNAGATVAVAAISVLSIAVHKLREISEARSTVDKHNPSATAERRCRCFSLAEIQSATRNFNGSLVIGRGGFGQVYKGHIDNGSRTVAVKRLTACPISLATLILYLLITTTVVSTNPTYFTGDVAINCGSTEAPAPHSSRGWLGDIEPSFSSSMQIKGSSMASTIIHSSSSADPVPHETARLSRSQFSYLFRVNPGQKIIRLHFNPTSYRGFKGLVDLFTVEAGPFTCC